MAFVKLNVKCPEELKEILFAELSDLGFDSFIETDSGFEGSILEEDYLDEPLENTLSPYLSRISFEKEVVADQNWNEKWESNYPYIIVDNTCAIRASFHPSFSHLPYEVIINPKMSFGTGHHPTTLLMLQELLKLDLKDKTVFDIGCGTGILAILAKKKGALVVWACDIEEWAFENTKENCSLNKAENIQIFKGTVSKLPKKDLKFDIILANINRNVLLEEIQNYYNLLSPEGKLILSGFYTEDNPIIANTATKLELNNFLSLNEKNWSLLGFEKKS